MSDRSKKISALMRAYARRFPVVCAATGADGRVRGGRLACRGCAAASKPCRAARLRAVSEALRWGEPCVQTCPSGRMMWGVPLLSNQHPQGGLIAVLRGRRAMTNPDPAQIDAAMSALLDAAIRQNLTNSALLSLRRTEARREREKAEAIHAVKDDALNSVHAAYLREEPALIAAVRGEDRGQARAIINRILTGVYFHGRNRPELLKSFVLELVVMMSRAAVEAGGDPAELLGFHYQALAELSSIRDEERLSHWLTSMLERLMNALRDHRQDPRAARLDRALRHMRSRLPEPLTRDGVARIAGLAPSYFSHLMIRTMGDSFTTLLTRMRVDHARHLLAHTDLPLSQIAQECGFADQSYFSKVFRRTTRATPRAYRRERQAGR